MIELEREYRTIDKRAWSNGPWMTEPDKAQWSDPATGLPCLANRHPSGGHWCGYVGVPPGHPLYGRDYSECLQGHGHDCWRHSPEALLRVHGGITYAAACMEGPEDTSICHVPRPGEPDHVWWFGWDAAHSGDLSPGHEALVSSLDLPSAPYMRSGVYRDLRYVQRECAELAAQLADKASLALRIASDRTSDEE